MHKNPPTFFQSLCDEHIRPVELAQEILIIDIVNVNITVLVLFPVLEVFKVISQHRDNMCNASLLQRPSPA